MAQFDPADEDLEATLKHLADADKAERDRVLALEVVGKKRKTVLEKYGIDPDARYDASGRLLYPWEAVGEQKADFGREEPEEDEEARKIREAQLEQDQLVAASSLGSGTSAPGSGTAPAAQGAGGGTTGSTVATAAGGAGGTTGAGSAGGSAGGATV